MIAGKPATMLRPCTEHTVVLFEREVVSVDICFTSSGKDGNDARESASVASFGELRKEVLNKKPSRVVM